MYVLFYYIAGYVIAHFPGGLLAERIGGKPVILLAIFTSSLLSILTPLAVVHGGVYGLFAVRVLLGCVQAGMYPAIATLLAAWIPKRERARVGGIVYCSGPVSWYLSNLPIITCIFNTKFSHGWSCICCMKCGAILGNSAAGFLIFSYQSWQVSFYTFGVVGIIIGILYVSNGGLSPPISRDLSKLHWIFIVFFYVSIDWQTILCASNPNAHPNITEAEKEYLQREIGQLEREKNLKAVPWREMCTSKPVIALFLSLVRSTSRGHLLLWSLHSSADFQILYEWHFAGGGRLGVLHHSGGSTKIHERCAAREYPWQRCADIIAMGHVYAGVGECRLWQRSSNRQRLLDRHKYTQIIGHHLWVYTTFAYVHLIYILI